MDPLTPADPEPGPGAVRVRPTGVEDVPALAQALGAALSGDPWMRWLVAADRHQERITGLQGGLLGFVGLPHGEVWLAEGPAGEVLGGALWLLAGRPVPPSAWALVAAQEAELMGDRHRFAVAAGAATRQLRPPTPHHHLATLGVVPSARRRGVGSALLAPVLAGADRSGVDAHLETSTEPNVRFYARLGFEVTGHAVVPDGGPPVWAMIRLPDGGRRTP